LSVVLRLKSIRPPSDDYWGAHMFREGVEKTIVLRRGQEPKLVRNMLQLWAARHARSKAGWLDKRIDADTRIGPNVQQFVQAVFAKYKDADDVVRDRAMDDLRKSVKRAQASGLTEHDLKLAWDEGLFSQMLCS
jgi:hypothetical protein